MTVVPGSAVEYIDLPGRMAADPLRTLATASSVRIVRVAHSRYRFAHRHPASEEVIYVHEGSGAIYVDGTFAALGPGDVVYVPAGAAHATVPDPGESMMLICFFPHPQLTENLEETEIDVMAEVRDE